MWADWPSLQPDPAYAHRRPPQPRLLEAPGARRADRARQLARHQGDADAVPVPDLGQRDGRARRPEEHGRRDLVRVLGPDDQGGMGSLRPQRPQPGRLRAEPARARVPPGGQRVRAGQPLGRVLRLPVPPLPLRRARRRGATWTASSSSTSPTSSCGPSSRRRPRPPPTASRRRRPRSSGRSRSCSRPPRPSRPATRTRRCSTRRRSATATRRRAGSTRATTLHARAAGRARRRSAYTPHSRQAWSHHNYTDVEKRQTATRTQLIRGLLARPLERLRDHRPGADRLHHRGRRAADADAGALSGRGPARGAGQVPARRLGAPPGRHRRRRRAWRCSPST